MIFIQAFLVCGVVCCISQFLVMNIKKINIFAVLMTIGAILGLIGVFGSLVDFGMMGVIIQIGALCEQFFESFLAVFKGEFGSLLTFLGLLGLIVFLCSIFGVMAKLPSNQSKERKLK